MTSRVLVLNAEPRTGAALQGALSLEGFQVLFATDDARALHVVDREEPDAVIVDVAASRTRGEALYRHLRQARPWLPVLLLGVRETGLVELLARLRSLIRRKESADQADLLRFADLTLDPVTHEVTRGARPIELTVTEFSLLELFLARPREVLSRAELFTRVWGYDFGAGSNALNVHVGRLRRKLEAAGEPRLVHTVRGVGYVLREP
jgi:two-component system, OmpR family, response regulator MprA